MVQHIPATPIRFLPHDQTVSLAPFTLVTRADEHTDNTLLSEKFTLSFTEYGNAERCCAPLFNRRSQCRHQPDAIATLEMCLSQ